MNIENCKKDLIDKHIKDPFINEMCKYAVEGGKNLRAFLFLKNSPDSFHNIPIAIEYIHATSLILDDLPFADNTLTRRNKDSFFVKYGVANTQLISFILINLANKIIFEDVREAFEERKKEFADLVSFLFLFMNDYIYGHKGLPGGQIMDLKMNTPYITAKIECSLGKPVTEIVEYLKCIKYKTCRLFQACYALPYVLNSYLSNSFEVTIFEKYKKIGKLKGFLFQLKDDLEDCDVSISKEEIQEYIKKYEEELKSIEDD